MRPSFIRPILYAAIAVPLFAAVPAQAQALFDNATCDARDIVTETLTAKFGEVQQGAGIVNADRVLELWRSDETGSWTILMTRPDGKTCIMAAGDFWRDQKGITGDPT